MPAAEREGEPMPPEGAAWYSYATLRVVPRVERGEYVNVGVILFVRTLGYLRAGFALDEARLRALAPDLDLTLVKRYLAAIEAVCAGSPDAGPLAAASLSERFYWLSAPRSTVIQASPVYVGCTTDPAATLEELLNAFVRPTRLLGDR